MDKEYIHLNKVVFYVECRYSDGLELVNENIYLVTPQNSDSQMGNGGRGLWW